MKKHIETIFDVQSNTLKLWRDIIGDTKVGGEELNAITKNIEAALDAMNEARKILDEIK